jgi:hypothetical protein
MPETKGATWRGVFPVDSAVMKEWPPEAPGLGIHKIALKHFKTSLHENVPVRIYF